MIFVVGQRTHWRVSGETRHVCEAAFRFLKQMNITDRSWQTMNRHVVVPVNYFNSTERIRAKQTLHHRNKLKLKPLFHFISRNFFFPFHGLCMLIPFIGADPNA